MPLVTRSSVQGNLYRQASAPSSANTGDVWVDTDDGLIYTYNGSSWVVQSVSASANVTIGGVTKTLSEWLSLGL